MKNEIIETNKVTVSGEIVSDLKFSHEIYGEKFYTFDLSVRRLSDATDTIPIMVSDRLVDAEADWRGCFVNASGQFRSFNKCKDGKRRLILSVFAREIEEAEETEEMSFDNSNSVSLDGFICKEPNYRETPLGREICDILLAVNRPYGKSDYIPLIIWGRNARFASTLQVGDKIHIDGRIQSREYQKKISEEEAETRVAYEVSCSRLELITEGDVEE